MGFPSAANSRPVDPILSRLLAGLGNPSNNLIAEQVLPGNIAGLGVVTPGDDISRMSTGTIQRLGHDSMFGEVNADAVINRIPGAVFHQSRGFTLDPMTYTARSFSGEAPVPYESLKDIQLGTGADAEIKAMFAGVEMSTLKIALERYIAALVFGAGNWDNAAAGTKWGVAGDDPMADINTLTNFIEDYGVKANTIVLGRGPARALRVSDGFREYLATDTDRQIIGEDDIVASLKKHFGFTNVHIGNARYNTSAVMGTLTGADIWGSSVWVGHQSDGGVLMGGGPQMNVQLDPTAMARIVVQDWTASEYDNESVNSVITQIQNRQWAGVVMKPLGRLLTAVV